jgi:hypothetical protein
MVGMSTYRIVRSIGDDGFDVAIVEDDGVRRTIPNFRTEADAAAWIAQDETLEPLDIQEMDRTLRAPPL